MTDNKSYFDYCAERGATTPKPKRRGCRGSEAQRGVIGGPSPLSHINHNSFTFTVLILLVRKRPFPKPGEKWSPKKHANRRVSPPAFVGEYGDTLLKGEKVVTAGRAALKSPRPRPRPPLGKKGLGKISLVGGSRVLVWGERKKPYRYRSNAKRRLQKLLSSTSVQKPKK